MSPKIVRLTPCRRCCGYRVDGKGCLNEGCFDYSRKAVLARSNSLRTVGLLAVTVRTDTDRRSSVGVGRGVGGCVRPPFERRCARCRKPWEVCNCDV